MAENFVVKAMHAAERRTASVKLGKTSLNEAVQRTRATRAENTNAVLEGRVKTLRAEKDRLTAQCDKSALVNQCMPGLAKEAKEARGPRLQVQRLKDERTKSTNAGRQARGMNRVAKLKASLGKTLQRLATAKKRTKKLDTNAQEAKGGVTRAKLKSVSSEEK